jgi:hypothetical protein
VPFALLFVVLFALAGAAVARRRGWPVLLGAAVAGAVPPVGVAAVVMVIADRARDAVTEASDGERSAADPGRRPGGRPPPRPGQAGPRRPRTPIEVPASLADSTVLRALRTFGPMNDQQLIAALVDPEVQVRAQLRELQRRGIIERRGGRFHARV